MDHFGGDETAFKIGVNDTGGLRGFGTGGNGPGAGFFFATGNIGAETDEVINPTDQETPESLMPMSARNSVASFG